MSSFLRGSAAALTAAVLIGVAGCSSSGDSSGSSAAATDSVKITYIADETGPGAFYGKGFVKGARYFADKVNAAGGIGGRSLDLTVVDSASDQATAVGAMTAATKSDAQIVMYSLLSGNALAMAPLAQKAKMPFLVGQAGVEGITSAGDYVYRTSTSEGDYYPGMINSFVSKGAKTMSIIYASDNATAVNNAKNTLPKAAADLGITIKDTIAVKTADTDYSSPATQIAESRPDVLVALVFGPAATTAITAIRNAGFDNPIAGSAALGAGALAAAKDAAKDTYYPSAFIPSTDLAWKSGVDFYNGYKRSTGEEPTFMVAGGNDQIQFLADALEKIGEGEVTRDTIKNALAEVAKAGFSGATGDPLKFGETRAAIGPGVLVRWDGTKETVAAESSYPLLPGYGK